MQYIYRTKQKTENIFCGWDDTRNVLTQLYFHCNPFNIKLKFRI